MKIKLKLHPIAILLTLFYFLSPLKGQDILSFDKKQLLTDTATINETNRKINLLWHTSPDSLIIVGKFTLRSSEVINYEQGQVSSLQIIGVGYYEKGENQKALSYYNKALVIADKLHDLKMKSLILCRRPLPLNAIGMYDLALKDLLESLKISKEIGYKKNFHQILNTLGMVYQARGNNGKALQYYREGKDYMESIQDSTLNAIFYGNIGNLLAASGDYEEAEKAYRRALALAEHFRNPKSIAYALKSLGTLFLTKREPQKSLDYFSKAKVILQKIGEKTEYLSLLDYLTDNQLMLNKKIEAFRYANETFKLAQRQGQLYYIGTSANSLSKLYELSGDFKKALDFERISRKATDSLSKSDVKEEMVRLEEQFKYEAQQQELKNKHQQQSRSQKIITLFCALAAILGAAIAFLIYRGLRKQRIYNGILLKTKKVIERKNIRLEAADQFKEHIISVLAHDVRSPVMGLKSFIDHFNIQDVAVEQVQNLMNAARIEVDTLKYFIDDVLVWVHSQGSDFELNQEVFDLASEIQQLLRLYKLRADEKHILLTYDLPEQLYIRGDTAVIKIIIRNLLDNAIKYCHDSDTIHLSTQSSQDDGKVRLELIDSGPGLSNEIIQCIQNQQAMQQPKLGSGFGLNLCLHYAYLLGNRLSVIPTAKGTSITLTLDLAISAKP